MSKVNVLGGNIPSGNWDFKDGMLLRFAEHIQIAGEVKTIEKPTPETLNELAEKAGWGFVQLADREVISENQSGVCVACEIGDGRKFLAITDAKTYQELLNLSLNVAQSKLQNPEQNTSPGTNSETTTVPNIPYELPNELLEKFYEQVHGRFDPTITQLKISRIIISGTPSNTIKIEIRNTKPVPQIHQVTKIKNAAKACNFGGQVTINVKKTWPKHSKDKLWSSTLICDKQDITVIDSGGCVIGLVALVILVGVVVSYCSAFPLISKRPAKVQTDQPTSPASAPPPAQEREYIGTSPNGGYSLYKEGNCVIVQGVTDGDLRRLNVSLGEFKQVIKEETGLSCVLLE